MVEPAVTNLLPNPDQIYLGGWSSNGGAFANYVTDPKLGTNATRWSFGAFGDGMFYRATSMADNGVYTLSVHFRPNLGGGQLLIGLENPTQRISIDVATGQVVSVAGVTNYGVIACKNGWYRAYVSFTADPAGNKTVTFYSAVTTLFSLDWYGAQLEPGNVMTSYAGVSRAADTITGTGLSSSSVAENDYAAYSSSTSYTLGQRVIVTSLHKVYESLRGGSSTVTISYASPAVIGWTAHGLPNGTAVTFTTTGALPTGLTAGTTYYVVNANTDTFNVAATLGGTAINTTGAGSGVHTGHDSANLNNDPSTSPTYWLDCGSTNRWKPFDSVVQSQLTATTNAAFTVNVPQLIDTVALLNTNAQSARVTAYYGSTQVYDSNVSLYTDEVEITDWSLYFFTDFRQQTDIILNDLPPYLNMNVSVSLAAASGNPVAVGAVIYGKAKDISSEKKGVEFGAKIGITDYSVKTKDAFGNYTITPRAFAKRANWDVYVNNEDIDFTFNLLSSIRTTPILFIGSTQYNSTAIYGYYKSWEVSIPYPDVSICTVEIDGLT
jgi:hypothetical protein